MRAAFAHASVKGWVYLEATMNLRLQHLLKITPGVVSSVTGLVLQKISHADGMKLLCSQHSGEALRAGQWVQVRRGHYKGDVGYVLSINSQQVRLLLVPRLLPPLGSNAASSVSPPALFDSEDVHHLYKIEPILIREHVYSFQGNIFEHGLMTKEYSFSLVSTKVSSMPFELVWPFCRSNHPVLYRSKFTFPRPSEWQFDIGENVYFVHDSLAYPPSFKTAVISALQTLSVELATEEGIVEYPWLALRKKLVAGKFVEITAGVHKGQTGWLSQVDIGAQVANVIPLSDRTEVGQTRTDSLPFLTMPQNFKVHVNTLKLTEEPPVIDAHPKHKVTTPWSTRVPWIGKEVIISGQHYMRGQKALIMNVLANQPTSSGLQVEIQSSTLHAVAPFRRMTIDYDDVVDARYLCF